MSRWIDIFSSVLCLFLLIFRPNPSLAEEVPALKGFGVKAPLPSFAFGWVDDKSTFQAGDIATIKIKLLDDSFSGKNTSLSGYAWNFSLSVSGKKGNSSYVSGVFLYLEGDPTFWNISFIPIRVGEFSVVISEDHFGVTDSSLHFTVTAGHMHPSACVVSLMNLVNDFVAGTKAFLYVLPKDAFGNNISSGVEGPHKDYFMVSASYDNGSAANVLDVRYNGWNGMGYIGVEFVPTSAGSLLLHVYGDDQPLSGSPLPFIVKPGPLDITNSLAQWKYGTNFLQVFSKLEIFIYQRDLFGNLVQGFYPFDARVVEKATKLSAPVGDLFFQELALGIQLLSFSVTEPGDFTLTIMDAKTNKGISNISYDYTVFIGYCDGSHSFLNGSGLAGSVAGRMSFFTVHLQDMYHNPSPAEAERLHVQILSTNGTSDVFSLVSPLGNLSESDLDGPAGSLPAKGTTEIIRKSTVRASDFNVTFTPEKSGDYDILVFCGNIPINDGHTYSVKVFPALVNASLSRVVRLAPGVKRLEKNDVLVQLMDSFLNPILSQQTKLSFQIDSANSSIFIRKTFVDNGDGSYVGYYQARDLGAYNICVSFEDKHLYPCPIEVHVFEKEYFSEAQNDTISVWEDESLAFDALLNDYVAQGPASIVESSIPHHGSLLQYGQLFRYTPLIGYFGNDSFSYTISDINMNMATGTVFVSVLCKPPQFVSLPIRLHVTEDVLSPKFRGFPGFEIMYSDLEENISVTIRAQSGTVLLAPMPMQLHQPLGSTLAVRRGGRAGKELILSGHVKIINGAFQFIQYVGKENFYGNDVISLYATNKNGIQDVHVPVFVEPINDPPNIHAPKFIFLGRKEASDWWQIFDKQRDVFEFSIADSDIFCFLGNKSHFMVTLSLEVNNGLISTSLPVNLIDTAELKIKSSNQWQPLQTYVTISNHFVLRGKGVRFRGTIGDCNKAMQRLFYQGGNFDAVLTVTVNDMGNYGCYPDCTEMMSSPLHTEVSVNLIKRRPVSSLTALLLALVIMVEIVMILSLGGLLLFFICRCMNALHSERKDSINNVAATREDDFNNQTGTMNAGSSQSMTYDNRPSRLVSLKNQHSNFHQRSCRGSEREGSGGDELPPSRFIGEGCQMSPFSIEGERWNNMTETI